MKPQIKTICHIDFSDVFRFAEEHYDIGWNTANDCFFNGVISYGKMKQVWSDCLEYSDYFYKKCKEEGTKVQSIKALDVPKEEVKLMSNKDIGYFIMQAYIEHHNIAEYEMWVDGD